MGARVAIYAGAQGGQRWAYPRGPAGLHTYMVRIDASGRLSGIDQVLDQTFLVQLRIDQGRQSEVLGLLGPYWQSAYFERQKEWVWTWRFRNVWGHPAQLHVSFDGAGLVRRYEQIEEDRSRRRWDITSQRCAKSHCPCDCCACALGAMGGSPRLGVGSHPMTASRTQKPST